MEYGIVYLLTNPVMPGLVKIARTTQEGYYIINDDNYPIERICLKIIKTRNLERVMLN